jgi:hypothetical protein
MLAFGCPRVLTKLDSSGFGRLLERAKLQHAVLDVKEGGKPMFAPCAAALTCARMLLRCARSPPHPSPHTVPSPNATSSRIPHPQRFLAVLVLCSCCARAVLVLWWQLVGVGRRAFPRLVHPRRLRLPRLAARRRHQVGVQAPAHAQVGREGRTICRDGARRRAARRRGRHRRLSGASPTHDRRPHYTPADSRPHQLTHSSRRARARVAQRHLARARETFLHQRVYDVVTERVVPLTPPPPGAPPMPHCGADIDAALAYRLCALGDLNPETRMPLTVPGAPVQPPPVQPPPHQHPAPSGAAAATSTAGSSAAAPGGTSGAAAAASGVTAAFEVLSGGAAAALRPWGLSQPFGGASGSGSCAAVPPPRRSLPLKQSSLSAMMGAHSTAGSQSAASGQSAVSGRGGGSQAGGSQAGGSQGAGSGQGGGLGPFVRWHGSKCVLGPVALAG